MSYNENRRDIGIYKANKRMTGSVAQFKMGNRNDCMFLEVAKQTGPMDSPKPYDWVNSKIVVKLGTTDICKLLAFFRLSAPASPLKLFHKNDTGSKIIEIKWQEKYSNYYLSISSKAGDDRKQVAVQIGLDEVELLAVGFKRAIEIILGW